MRTVLTGTPEKLRRLRDRDLPGDRDLRQSFWQWVDFSDYDLSCFDMRDMDILDSVGARVILPSRDIDGIAATDYIQARRTLWDGAIIPKNVSSLHHDFVREVIHQLSGGDPFFEGFVAYLGESYENSLGDALYHVRKRLGMPTDAAVGTEDKIGMAGKLRQNYPRLFFRLARLAQGEESVRSEPPAIRRNVVRVLLSGRAEDFVVPLGVLDDDRFIASQQLAERIEAEFGEPVWCHVSQNDPFLQAKAGAKVIFNPTRWDWWHGAGV